MFIKETKQEVSSCTYAFERRRAPPRSDGSDTYAPSELCPASPLSRLGGSCGSCACECEKKRDRCVCATAGGKYAINW